MVDAEAREITLDMIKFIEASPTAAHAAGEAARRLEEVGFKRLEEKDRWQVEPGDRFYVIRDYVLGDEHEVVCYQLPDQGVESGYDYEGEIE